MQAAFAGESQARNKYTYYASVAKKAGYEQIKAFFEETANNEKEHAKIWFKKSEKKTWICRNCDFIYEGEEAPKTCPVCAHPQAFFELKNDNF